MADSTIDQLLGRLNNVQFNAASGGITVTARFDKLLENLRLTTDQRNDGIFGTFIPVS